MCGIAGIVALDGFEPQKLIAITQMISYRGPSGYGFAFDDMNDARSPDIFYDHEDFSVGARPLVGLGNRRLAILDLSPAGNQPLQIGNGRFCVTYNGEIYNYKELRTELEKFGHLFVSGTDTEVLLRSYQQWGEECLPRFNGMWSFAIWDRRERKLFCARDRFGVKPFYYVLSPRAFYFASEIKQVLAASGIERQASPDVISDFLEWGLQDHLAETSFQGVFQLQGGHALTLAFREPLAPVITKYWELQSGPELRLSAEEAVSEFEARFSDAVRLRLRSDVSVGISLSGGLDSSAVLCKAKRVSPQSEFQTFSACFEDAQLDERRYISAATKATNSTAHLTFPEQESFWKSLETIAYHQDEPIGGSSVFAQWSVMRKARDHGVPVLLGGQGGDEALCGYRKYYLFHLWHLFRVLDPAFVTEGLQFAITMRHSYLADGALSRYLPGFLRKSASPQHRLTSASLRMAPRDVRWIGPAKSIAERQKIDLLKTSLPKLLRHEDRNSMAHSIETRLPFLDYRLVEMAVRCPASLKLRGGWSKWLLREATAGTLPDEIRLRKSKLGFNTPEADWLRKGLSNGHRDLWDPAQIRLDKYLDPKRLARECRRFVDAEPGALPAESLFRAISLEVWARVHQVS